MSPLLPDSWASNIASHAYGGDYTLLSPTVVTRPNNELYLTYGAHPNKTLFIEYGFVNRFSGVVLGHGDLQGEVDVQIIVERLFEDREKLGDWMKRCLMDEGYWG